MIKILRGTSTQIICALQVPNDRVWVPLQVQHFQSSCSGFLCTWAHLVFMQILGKSCESWPTWLNGACDVSDHTLFPCYTSASQPLCLTGQPSEEPRSQLSDGAGARATAGTSFLMPLYRSCQIWNSDMVCLLDWTGVWPFRQAGIGRRGGLPGDRMSVRCRAPSLSTLIDELMQQGVEGGFSPW